MTEIGFFKETEFPGHIWCSSRRFQELNPIDYVFIVAVVDKESHSPCPLLDSAYLNSADTY